MDQKEFDVVLSETILQINILSKLKGGEYAGDHDRLANFKRNAAALGVTPLLIWGVYAGKHWDAISQYINDHQNGKYRQRAEPIKGRLDDLIVYCVLMKALLLDYKQTTLDTPLATEHASKALDIPPLLCGPIADRFCDLCGAVAGQRCKNFDAENNYKYKK